MRAGPDLRIATGRHLGATTEGEIALTLRGRGGDRGTVTLKSERRIPSRWLERGRPRVVTLARRRFSLSSDGGCELTLQLSPEHLALLRRMGSLRAVARAATAESRTAKAVTIHAPARRPVRRTAAGAGSTA